MRSIEILGGAGLSLFLLATALFAQVDQAPMANAGPDQTVTVGDQVQLDGSASYDPENDVLAYDWFQTGGVPVSLANAASAFPTFVAAASDVYVFRLTVNDGLYYSAPDEVRVTAEEPADDDGDQGEDDDTAAPYEPENDDQSGCGF